MTRRRTLIRKGINKRCTKCQVVKLLEEFGVKRSNKDGIETRCKECKRQYSKQWYTNNPEKVQQYRETNKGVITAYRNVYNKKYREENKQNLTDQSKQYYQTHKKERAQYRDANHDKIARVKKLYRQALCTFNRVADLPPADLPKFENDILTVACKYEDCANRFQPTNSMVECRIQASKDATGAEMHFYCSQECKDKCILYRHKTNHIDPRSKLAVKKTDQETARADTPKAKRKLIKHLCETTSKMECEICGDFYIDLHHTLPVAEYGLDSMHPDSHMLVCPGCHTELHDDC